MDVPLAEVGAGHDMASDTEPPVEVEGAVVAVVEAVEAVVAVVVVGEEEEEVVVENT